MSRVYFHSVDDDAEVRGSERAYAGLLTTALTMAVFENHIERYGDEQPLKLVLPPESYLQTTAPQRFYETFRTWLQVGYGDDAYFILGDNHVSSWNVILNTITVIGNEPLKFLARMHAQCEIHGYVEGCDRKWLADIINAGRKDGLYRRNAGWESAVALLESADDSPVVMSYSVCEQFPNAGIANWYQWPDGAEHDYGKLTETQKEAFDEHSDKWHDLTDDERWRRGIDGLRAKGGNLRIQPDGFADYGYGNGLSAFDVLEFLVDSKLTTATPSP